MRRSVRVRRRAFCLSRSSLPRRPAANPASIRLDSSNSRRSSGSRPLRGDLARLASESDPSGPQSRVSVRPAKPAAAGDLPAMAGRYTTDETLRFWPSFPLDPGRDATRFERRILRAWARPREGHRRNRVDSIIWRRPRSYPRFTRAAERSGKQPQAYIRFLRR